MKVLIVEDERIIAQSVAQLVGEHPSCQVVGVVGNGAEALALLETTPADLVITDIRMPVMDGKELLRQLQIRHPQCMTVVLSGFSDFEYVRAALQSQAMDYLLKPVVKSKLFPVLDKVLDAWGQQEQTRQRAVIQKGLDGTLLPSQTSQSAWLLLSRPSQESPEAVFGPGCHVFRSASEQLLVVTDQPQTPQLAQTWFQQRQEPLACTAGAVPLWNLQNAAAQLRTAVKYQTKLFRPQLLLVDLSSPQGQFVGTPLRDLRPNRAVDAICTRQTEDLLACLLEVLELPDIRRIDVQNYLDAVLSDTRLAYNLSPEHLSQLKAALSEQLTQAKAPETCAQALADRLLGSGEQTPAKRSVAEIVQEIVAQLDAECHLPFTTEGLAKQHGLTPRYLNKVFREQMGVRPMEYLVTLRMQRARHILETTPDARIKDVANSVGYPDPLYFSKTFKKELGIWPKDAQGKR